MFQKISILLIIFTIQIPISWADEFYLRDGTVIEGKIIAQSGSQYLIKTKDKTLRVDIYQIKKIKTDPVRKKPVPKT